uniref:Uncharacterized protein n=1 Tax=Micrurus lemniscatus lemniscatus TaxID=129467 RepID=A0A2D4HU01_MICLE
MISPTLSPFMSPRSPSFRESLIFGLSCQTHRRPTSRSISRNASISSIPVGCKEEPASFIDPTETSASVPRSPSRRPRSPPKSSAIWPKADAPQLRTGLAGPGAQEHQQRSQTHGFFSDSGEGFLFLFAQLSQMKLSKSFLGKHKESPVMGKEKQDQTKKMDDRWHP